MTKFVQLRQLGDPLVCHHVDVSGPGLRKTSFSSKC